MSIYKITGKLIDHEIITKSHNEIITKIKESLFPFPTVKILNTNDSELISIFVCGKETRKLAGKTLFCYVPYKYFNNIVVLPEYFKKYCFNLEEKLKKVLMLNKATAYLEILIKWVDKLNIGNPEDQEKLEQCARYNKKMKLERFYDNLVMFILITFQDHFYIDFAEQREIPDKLLEDAFIDTIKPFLKMKEQFEKYVSLEYPAEKLTKDINNMKIGNIN